MSSPWLRPYWLCSLCLTTWRHFSLYKMGQIFSIAEGHVSFPYDKQQTADSPDTRTFKSSYLPYRAWFFFKLYLSFLIIFPFLQAKPTIYERSMTKRIEKEFNRKIYNSKLNDMKMRLQKRSVNININNNLDNSNWWANFTQWIFLNKNDDILSVKRIFSHLDGKFDPPPPSSRRPWYLFQHLLYTWSYEMDFSGGVVV